MGRVLMYLTIGALAAFLLFSWLFLYEGGAGTAAADVSVHDLSFSPTVYAGHLVKTQGVLRFEEAEQRYMLTADGLAVVVRGYSAVQLEGLVGRSVEVSGKVGFDNPEIGLYIDADAVTPLE